METHLHSGMLFLQRINVFWNPESSLFTRLYQRVLTLRSEITAEFVCRVLNHMKTLNTGRVVANFNPDDASSEDSAFIGDFNPGYITRSAHPMAKQSTKDPWRFNQKL